MASPTDPRLAQQPLWRRPDVDYHDIPIPDGWAGPVWQRVARIAAAAGLWPADLVAVDPDTGHDGLAQLTQTRGWQPATHTLYAKACRAAGLPVTVPPTPEPSPIAGPWTLLWSHAPTTRHPTHVRAAIWARLTVGWAADISHWATLPATAAARTGLGGLDVTITPPDQPDQPATIIGAGPLLGHWLDIRATRPATRHAATLLCTLKAGPTGTRPGAAMSARTLRHAFAAHAAATGHTAATDPAHHRHAADLADLTYDTWRRICAAAGAPTTGRGTVRAGRTPPPPDIDQPPADPDQPPTDPANGSH